MGVERGPLEEAAANAVADEVEMNRARRMLRASEQQQGGGGGGGGWLNSRLPFYQTLHHAALSPYCAPSLIRILLPTPLDDSMMV